jgi:hypothetical protein
MVVNLETGRPLRRAVVRASSPEVREGRWRLRARATPVSIGDGASKSIDLKLSR